MTFWAAGRRRGIRLKRYHQWPGKRRDGNKKSFKYKLLLIF